MRHGFLYAPRPHTPARTRSGTCSALLSSAFPVASLAFLPPLFVYRSLIRRLEYPYEAWISVVCVCMLCGCASVNERTLLCLFLCVSRCFRGETVCTVYSTWSDVDTHGHAHSCAHQRINDAFVLPDKQLGTRAHTALLTRGSADVYSRARAPCSCVSHRSLSLEDNQLTFLSPTQFDGLTSLTYVAISLSSPAHARPHTQRHMQRPAQQRFPSR